tara:strand:+ start:19422 stop:20405 length:984 start_codon:yes stop_codon:yes gene_type:complete
MDILTIADGEQITAPGAYRTSMDWYHTQAICPGPSVSSTGLRKIALQSPHAFWKTWEGNPDRYPPKEPGDALVLGKAAHCLILGDEVFDENFFYVEDGAPRRPTAPQVKAFERDGKWSDAAAKGAAYWEDADKRAAGKHLITAEQITKIKYMAENLAANPLCVELLRSDLIEISMIWQDEQTGIWVKSRPDCLPSNGYDFGDLKTFSPKSRDLILSAHRSVTDFGYAMQMALAVMGAEQVLGSSATECGLVFVQTSEPYEAIPVRIDADSLYWARVLCRDGLNKMAECLKSGEWLGVGAEMTTYSYPPSMLTRFSEMQSDGRLPNDL